MSFFHKMHFTSYCVTVQLAVCPRVVRILYTMCHVAVFFFNVRICAFNFTVKIKYPVVAVFLQCSCRFLYVHPCLSSHGVCLCVCVRACVFMDARLPANLAFGGLFLRGMAKLERPPKILCSNWNCFIFSLIN